MNRFDGTTGERIVYLNPHVDDIWNRIYEEGSSVLCLIACDCGHFATVDPKLPKYPLYAGKSWSGRHVCHQCQSRCRNDHRLLCTGGDADGRYVEDEDGKRWLCLECWEAWDKEQNRKAFWSGFWEGLFK